MAIIKKKRKEKGFSLLGVIIAMFIMIVGMVGILGLLEMSFYSAYSSKMKLTASGLAQEGIEIVRGIRRRQSDWDAWYSSIPNSGMNISVQYNSDCLGCCPGGSCPSPGSNPKLKINSSGFYQYDSGNESSFTRMITIEKISSNEIKVISEVNWQRGSSGHFFRIEDRLWNWK